MERGRMVALAFFALFLLMGVRAVFLTLFPTAEESLSSIAESQYQQKLELAPYRGTISDRRGDPLAISIRKPSLAVNPRIFKPTRAEIARLASILGVPQAEIRQITERKGYFAWLARQVPFPVAERVRALELKGLFELREPSRFYPSGEAAAHLVGMVGLDNKGLLGLERFYERDLKGQPLVLTAFRDGLQRTIFKQAEDTAPEKTGNSIHLTLDRVIQEIAEEELAAGVKAAKAKKGFAVVSDPHTGRILAMANYPLFDPNDARKVDIKKTRNHALMDLFEPGSVTKPFVIAKALEARKTTVDERHDCEKGFLRIGGRRIRDTHPADVLTTAETIIASSNICTYKIARLLGPDGTHGALADFGFGTREIALGLPGEAHGYIAGWQDWRPIRFANIAFGQGFMVSALEMTAAMGAIANGGTLLKPTLVERIISSDGLVMMSRGDPTLRRVLKPETTRTMREILRRVVDEKSGTGKLARTSSYSTAGKTGTAQKVDPGIKGYAKDKYLVSFVGFAPARDPHLVVYVAIDEPNERPYYGGVWAAPVFARIVERSLKYLNVAPDLPTAATAPQAAKTGANADKTKF